MWVKYNEKVKESVLGAKGYSVDRWMIECEIRERKREERRKRIL
jgi:hypothetical protein